MEIGLLEAPALIRDRIVAACPSVKFVFLTDDIGAVKESGQKVPAAHIVHGGYRPLTESGPDRRWREDILVVAVVKHVAQADGQGDRQALAAPMLREIMAALDGWRVPGACRALQAVAGPAPIPTATHTYFPLVFSHEVIMVGYSGN